MHTMQTTRKDETTKLTLTPIAITELQEKQQQQQKQQQPWELSQ